MMTTTHSMLLLLAAGANVNAQCRPNELSVRCDEDDSDAFTSCSCSEDVATLDFERGSNSEEFCTFALNGEASLCSFDSLLAECEDFCAGAGGGTGVNTPMPIGSDQFGFDLEQTVGICLDSDIGGEGATEHQETKHGECRSLENAFPNVEGAAIAFVATMREFQCATLSFRGSTRKQVEDFKARLSSDETRVAVQSASRDQKPAILKAIYNEGLAGGSAGDIAFQLAIEKPQEKMRNPRRLYRQPSTANGSKISPPITTHAFRKCRPS